MEFLEQLAEATSDKIGKARSVGERIVIIEGALKAAVLDERERCARVAELVCVPLASVVVRKTRKEVAEQIAAAIRRVG